MRQAIAAAMAKSKREIPHYYLGTHIDVSRAQSWLAQANAERPVKERVLFAAVLLKAVARAVKEVPELKLASTAKEQLEVGMMLYPTGAKQGVMWEVEDELGNKGWVSSMLFGLSR